MEATMDATLQEGLACTEAAAAAAAAAAAMAVDAKAAAAAAATSRLVPLASLLDPVTEVTAQYVGEINKYIPVFVAFQVAFFLFFLAAMQLVRVSRAKRAEFASCCLSFAHNVVSIVLATPTFFAQWPCAFDSPGTLDQHIVLQYSVAYMITDLCCFLLPFTPTDYLFVGHHIATGLYMWDTVNLQRAAITVLPWLVAGECTGPLLNVFTVAKTMRKTSPAWQKMFSASSPIFTVAFVLVRTIAMPGLLVWWINGLLTDCHAVPLGHRIGWMALVLLGTLGSQVWSLKLLQGFFRSKKRKVAAAAKLD